MRRQNLARKLVYPNLIIKYINSLLNKNQDILQYILNDYKKKPVLWYPVKKRRKFTLSSVSRFIKHSLKRKKKNEDYIKRKTSFFDSLIKDRPLNINLVSFIKLKDLISRVPEEKLKQDKNEIVIKEPSKKVQKRMRLKDKIKGLGQVKPTRLLTRFRNLLAKRGNLYKAELLLQRVRYMIKLILKGKKKKKKALQKRVKLNKVFLKVLASARPFLILKTIKKSRKNKIFKTMPLSLQRSTSLAQRGIMLSINKRSERLLVKRIALEFIAIYKKKPNSTQTALTTLRKDIKRNYALL